MPTIADYLKYANLQIENMGADTINALCHQ